MKLLPILRIYQIQTLLDTGFTCSLLDHNMFMRLKSLHALIKLDKIGGEYTQIQTVDDKSVKTKGYMFTNLWLREQHYLSTQLYVVTTVLIL